MFSLAVWFLLNLRNSLFETFFLKVFRFYSNGRRNINNFLFFLFGDSFFGWILFFCLRFVFLFDLESLWFIDCFRPQWIKHTVGFFNLRFAQNRADVLNSFPFDRRLFKVSLFVHCHCLTWGCNWIIRFFNYELGLPKFIYLRSIPFWINFLLFFLLSSLFLFNQYFALLRFWLNQDSLVDDIFVHLHFLCLLLCLSLFMLFESNLEFVVVVHFSFLFDPFELFREHVLVRSDSNLLFELSEH